MLSIDGGGIKGIFPAKFLACIEEEIGEGQIHKHFQLICGTSTGGIIALALSLGIPAKDIYDLYLNNAKTIFGGKNWNLIRKAFYNSHPLEQLIREIFKKHHNGVDDPRIINAKTKLLIPVYSLMDGSTQVLKTPHTSDLIIDKHIPMYMAAMATAAAPFYFNAYSNQYKKIESETVVDFSNKVDGGVYANNPSMNGIIEARTRFEKELDEIQLLSLGTGQKLFSDPTKKNTWSVLYWIRQKRIIELFMQSQSQIVHNSVSILNQFNEDFGYKRIDLTYNQNFDVKMDETNHDKLKKLGEKSARIFQQESRYVLDTFFSGGNSAA